MQPAHVEQGGRARDVASRRSLTFLFYQSTTAVFNPATLGTSLSVLIREGWPYLQDKFPVYNGLPKVLWDPNVVAKRPQGKKFPQKTIWH